MRFVVITETFRKMCGSKIKTAIPTLDQIAPGTADAIVSVKAVDPMVLERQEDAYGRGRLTGA